MYGGGLVTPGEVDTFIGQHKYAALAFYNHQTVTYYDYNSSTNALIAHIIDKRNKDYGCQRFNSKHVAIPKDVSEKAPDRGVIFYHNQKQVAVMSGYDVDEFARVFDKMVKDGEEASANNTRPSCRDKPLPPLPANANTSTSSCCLIL
ncbi:hypothetical protein EV175_000986 [Coemansia sp. RSA 1933]|nr:hypothetical protein EV175_000986 [Coemansia sp. RSA 1933]